MSAPQKKKINYDDLQPHPRSTLDEDQDVKDRFCRLKYSRIPISFCISLLWILIQSRRETSRQYIKSAKNRNSSAKTFSQQIVLKAVAPIVNVERQVTLSGPAPQCCNVNMGQNYGTGVNLRQNFLNNIPQQFTYDNQYNYDWKTIAQSFNIPQLDLEKIKCESQKQYEFGYFAARINSTEKKRLPFQTIPRVIFQTVKNRVVSTYGEQSNLYESGQNNFNQTNRQSSVTPKQDLCKRMHNWAEINPDYDYLVFDDDNIRNFISQQYGVKILNVFDCLKIGAAKSDFFRYLVLYRYGGFYFDVDTIALEPLSKWGLDRLVPHEIELDVHIKDPDYNLELNSIESSQSKSNSNQLQQEQLSRIMNDTTFPRPRQPVKQHIVRYIDALTPTSLDGRKIVQWGLGFRPFHPLLKNAIVKILEQVGNGTLHSGFLYDSPFAYQSRLLRLTNFPFTQGWWIASKVQKRMDANPFKWGSEFGGRVLEKPKGADSKPQNYLSGKLIGGDQTHWREEDKKKSQDFKQVLYKHRCNKFNTK